MNKLFKILLVVILTIGGLFGLAYYSFMQIDFIGHKDPEVVKANLERWDKMLLEAEFSDGTNYFKINLLDSVNIEIDAGDAAKSIFRTERYKISGDTIIIIGGIKHPDKYINASELVIQKDRVLYLKYPNGAFDTVQTLNLKFNKLKK